MTTAPTTYDLVLTGGTLLDPAQGIHDRSSGQYQVVMLLVRQAIQKWGARPVEESPDISDADLAKPKELVYPRLRRLEYADPDDQPS